MGLAGEDDDRKGMARVVLLALIVVALGVLAAVCLHSLEEIHYLKSFFPERFTVEQAYYAALIELVKVAIIALPLVVAIAVCLRLLGAWRRGR